MSYWRVALKQLASSDVALPARAISLEQGWTANRTNKALNEARRLGFADLYGDEWVPTKAGEAWAQGRVVLGYNHPMHERPGYYLRATWLHSLPVGIRIEQSKAA